MPSADRTRIKSGRKGGRKWQLPEIYVVGLMNTDFHIDDSNGDQPKLLLAIFPDMRPDREYSTSHLRDAFKQRLKDGKGKDWALIDRPNAKNKSRYTQEELERLAVYRGWIVEAAQAEGVALPDLTGLDITSADAEFIDEMQQGLWKVATKGMSTHTTSVDASVATIFDISELTETYSVAGEEEAREANNAAQKDRPETSSNIVVKASNKRQREANGASESQLHSTSKRRRQASETREACAQGESNDVEANETSQGRDETSAISSQLSTTASSATAGKPSNNLLTGEHQQLQMDVNTQPTVQQDAPAPNTPLPMVHHCHLTFGKDHCVFEPLTILNGNLRLVRAEAGFIHPSELMYLHGGPVVTVLYHPMVAEADQRPRLFDVMVCLREACDVCRPELAGAGNSVPDVFLRGSPTFCLPAVHHFEVRCKENRLIFQHAENKTINTQDGWSYWTRDTITAEDNVIFNDGQARRVAVCEGKGDCAFCTAADAAEKQVAQAEASIPPANLLDPRVHQTLSEAVYQGYQVVQLAFYTPGLIKSDLKPGPQFDMIHCRDITMVNGILVLTKRNHGADLTIDERGFIKHDRRIYQYGGPIQLIRIKDDSAAVGYGNQELMLCYKDGCHICSNIDFDQTAHPADGPRIPTVHWTDCEAREDGLFDFKPKQVREYKWINKVDNKDVVFEDGLLRAVGICAGALAEKPCQVCKTEVEAGRAKMPEKPMVEPQFPRMMHTAPQQGPPLEMVHQKFVRYQDGMWIYAYIPNSAPDCTVNGLIARWTNIYLRGGRVTRLRHQTHAGAGYFDMQVCDPDYCKFCNPDAQELPDLSSWPAALPTVLRRQCQENGDGYLEFKPEVLDAQRAAGEATNVEEEKDVIFSDGTMRKVMVAEE